MSVELINGRKVEIERGQKWQGSDGEEYTFCSDDKSPHHPLQTTSGDWFDREGVRADKRCRINRLLSENELVNNSDGTSSKRVKTELTMPTGQWGKHKVKGVTFDPVRDYTKLHTEEIEPPAAKVELPELSPYGMEVVEEMANGRVQLPDRAEYITIDCVKNPNLAGDGIMGMAVVAGGTHTPWSCLLFGFLPAIRITHSVNETLRVSDLRAHVAAREAMASK